MSSQRYEDIIISPERAKTCARKLREILKNQHGIDLKISEVQNMVANIADVSGGWHGLAKLPEVNSGGVFPVEKASFDFLDSHDIYTGFTPTLFEYAEVFTEEYESRKGVFYFDNVDSIDEDNAATAFLHEIVRDKEFPKKGNKEDLLKYLKRKAGEDSPFIMFFHKAWECYEKWLESEDEISLTVLQKNILKARINAKNNGIRIPQDRLFWPYLMERAKDDTWVFRNRNYGIVGFNREPMMKNDEWQSHKKSITGFNIREISEIEAEEIFCGSKKQDVMYFFESSCPPWDSEELTASYLVRLNWLLEKIIIK